MFTGLAAILASPILGSLFGFFGSWVSKREDRKSKELDYAHQEKMSELAHTQKIEYREVDGAAKIKEQDALSFTKAIESTTVGGDNWFKSAIRPVVTLYLLVVITYIAYQLNIIIGGMKWLPIADLIEMYSHLIATAEMLTTMSVQFWFGIRPIQNRKE